MALENPSTARDPRSSSILISRPQGSGADGCGGAGGLRGGYQKDDAMVKNAPRSKTGLWLVKNTRRGRLKNPTSEMVLLMPEKSINGAMPATVKITDSR